MRLRHFASVPLDFTCTVVKECLLPGSIFVTSTLAAENKLWFQPTCTGTAGEAGLVGPSPRAFHVAVAIDCNMFIFGGRYGRKRFDAYTAALLFRFVKCFHSFAALKRI